MAHNKLKRKMNRFPIKKKNPAELDLVGIIHACSIHSNYCNSCMSTVFKFLCAKCNADSFWENDLEAFQQG